MTETQRSIKYEVDAAALNKAKQQIDQLNKKQADVAKKAIESGKGFDVAAKELKKLQKAQRDAASVISALSGDFANQEGDVERATRALEAYEDRLKAVQNSGADLSGDLASSSGGLRGAADALTGGNSGALGGGLELTEAFADLGEFVPRLKSQIGTLGDVMREGDSAASKMVTGLGDGISAVTGMSAGTASFAAVALPVAAILAGAAVALHGFSKAMEAQRVQVEAAANALVDTNRSIAEGLTSDEAEAELERLEALRAAEVQSIQELESAYEGIQEGLDEQLGVFSGIVGAGVRAFDSREQQLADTIRDSQSTVQGYDAEIRRLNEALDNGELAANDTATAETELADTRMDEMARVQAQQEQAANRAAQLFSQYDDIVANSAQRQADSAEIAAVQADIDRENQLQKEADHNDKLASIRESGQQRIRDLESEITGLGQARQKELASIQAKGSADLSKLQADYQKRTQDSYADFTKRLDRSTSDAAKSIRRLSEDISQSLDEASRANDVEAFLKAQRDGNKQLSRAGEDASEAQARQVQDFIDGREKERQAFEEKQRDILARIEQEKQETIAAYDERRAALAEQIELERQAIEQNIAAEQARFEEQQRREDIRAEQQQRLADIRERQQQEAHDRRLEAIQTEAQAQQQASQAHLASLRRIEAAAASINVGGGSRTEPVSSGRGGDRNNPFGRQGSNFNFTQNNTIGDVASRAYVANETRQSVEQTFRTFADFFNEVS